MTQSFAILHFPITFTDLPFRLECVICKSVLKNAKQTSCGCRMCETCITDYLSDGPKPCPSKQIDCSNILLDMKDVHQDNAANKEVGNLIINCPFQSCEYSNSVKGMAYHIDICEFREIECERCKNKVQYKYKMSHDTTECEMRCVICVYCDEEMPYKSLQTVHLNYEDEALCLKFVTICPNKCEIKNKINLKEHLKVCSNKKLKCPFRSLKCDSVTMTKKNLKSHLQQDYIPHISDVIEIILNLSRKIENLSLELENQKELTKDIIQKTSCSTKYYLTVQKSVEDLQKNPPRTIQTITKSITFRNGNYIWKITGFETIRNDAERGSRISVISDPFYTSEFGYKICLKIYPAGDGMGKGTHLSVFFAIMKGEYDDLLLWPFKQKVTLSILDQEAGVKHHTEIYKPDILSICYQKPIEEYNTASGSPKFIPLSEIGSNSIYRRNDTIYLKSRSKQGIYQNYNLEKKRKEKTKSEHEY